MHAGMLVIAIIIGMLLAMTTNNHEKSQVVEFKKAETEPNGY